MAQPPMQGSRPGGEAGGTGDVARQQGQQVKDEATQQAQQVAGTAREEAMQVRDQAAGHARDLAENAKQQVHHQARQQTENLGGALGQFSHRVHALAEGRPEEAGPVSDYAERLAGQVDQLAGRVNELGFDGMVDEIQRFARRRPGAFLAGAAIAGFAASRLARGAQAAQQSGDGAGADRTITIPEASQTSPTAPGATPRAGMSTGTPSAAPVPPPTTPGGGTTPTTGGPPPRDPAVRPDPLSPEQGRR